MIPRLLYNRSLASSLVSNSNRGSSNSSSNIGVGQVYQAFHGTPTKGLQRQWRSWRAWGTQDRLQEVWEVILSCLHAWMDHILGGGRIIPILITPEIPHRVGPWGGGWGAPTGNDTHGRGRWSRKLPCTYKRYGAELYWQMRSQASSVRDWLNLCFVEHNRHWGVEAIVHSQCQLWWKITSIF